MVQVGAKTVLGDVHLADKEFGADKGAVGIGEVGFAVADGLNLGACQHNAGSVVVEKEVFVLGSFVLDFYDVLFFHASITAKAAFYFMRGRRKRIFGEGTSPVRKAGCGKRRVR